MNDKLQDFLWVLSTPWKYLWDFSELFRFVNRKLFQNPPPYSKEIGMRHNEMLNYDIYFFVCTNFVHSDKQHAERLDLIVTETPILLGKLELVWKYLQVRIISNFFIK